MRTTAVVGRPATVPWRAIAEYTRPARRQPGRSAAIRCSGLSAGRKNSTLTGEAQLDFLRVHRSPSRICHGFNVRPRSPPRDSAIAQHGRHVPPGALHGRHAHYLRWLVCFVRLGVLDVVAARSICAVVDYRSGHRPR